MFENNELLYDLAGSELKVSHGKAVIYYVDLCNFDGIVTPKPFSCLLILGCWGMRERADLIGTYLDAQSEAGRGTRLSVRLGVPSNKSKKEK